MRQLGLALPLLITIASLAGCQIGQTSDDPTQTAEPARTAINGRIPLTASDAAAAHDNRLLPPNVNSLLPANARMRSGDYMWDDHDVPDGPIQVWVDLRRQMVSVYRDGHEIGSAVIMYGAFDKETPLGSFDVLRKVADYHSRSYDAPMPYSLFITNDGIALHGSRMGANRATHGCVGLPIAFARKLFDASEAGDAITIVRSDPVVAGGTGLPDRSG